MVKPIFKNIIVEPIVKETTEGGIILGDAKEKKPIGKVISVGDEVTLIKPGETVLFSKYDGIPFEFNDAKFLIMQEESVLAIIE
ncbi:MAG TPA: co-chaperone GroES [Candidatus Dojkabacteria bacterium]|nr:co-chaperone GroES [Candidatus Dojkabacteria bacterium]